MIACQYCNCEVEAHDPVFVQTVEDGERHKVGAFCNFGCLTAYIEESGLAVGTRCRLDA